MKKISILIIEDDKFILKAMQSKFKQANFLVKASSSAEEGLKILAKLKPDAIILDILLPGINGYEFLEEIKKDPVWNKIPVIIASNLSEDPEITVKENKGYVDYVVKSELDLDDLVSRTKKIIALQ